MAQEILFENTIGESTIKLTDSSNVYRILYINDSIKKGVILLEEYRYDPRSRGSNVPNQKSHHWFGIVNTTVKDNILYILYYNYGLVQLKTYCFLKDEKVKEKSYFIDKKNLSPFMSGGQVYFFSEMKWFNNDMFMYITTGQLYGSSGTDGLYMYKSNIDSVKRVFFGECQIIEEQSNLLLNLDLDEKKDTVSKHIKKVLLETKQLNKDNEFKYLGYIDDSSSFYSIMNSNDRSSGMLYFFYQDALSLLDSIKIIRYDSYDREWLLNDYSEKAIKAPINIDFLRK